MELEYMHGMEPGTNIEPGSYMEPGYVNGTTGHTRSQRHTCSQGPQRETGLIHRAGEHT